jgi:hypothetical protein
MSTARSTNHIDRRTVPSGFEASFFFFLSIYCLLNGPCELISARGGASAAAYAFKTLYGESGISPFEKAADRLKIPVAAVGENDVAELAFHYVEIDPGGAGAGSFVSVVHFNAFPFFFLREAGG